MIEYAKPMKKLCERCRFAKSHFMDSCYCTRYGITIGYSKTECRGFEEDAYEVWQREDYD